MSHRMILVVVLLGTFAWRAVTVSAQADISAELSRAQAFYQANQFQESVILLTELERRLGVTPQRTDDLLKLKLYLGLSQLALNQTEQAKSKFVELCKLDPRYTLNPRDFPARAITLFDEAKGSCIAAANPVPGAISSSITHTTFLQGKELYDKGEFEAALKYFNVVTALDSSHELAREYTKLAQQRLDLVAQQIYLDWRTNFSAKQFDKAAAAYGKLRANGQPEAAKLGTQIESEYSQALSSLTDSWRTACASRDDVKADSLRREAASMSSGLPFTRDALGQMQQCALPPDRPVTSTSNRPAVAANQPAPVTNRPAAAPTQPAPATNQPAPAPNRPAATTPRPAPPADTAPVPKPQKASECMLGDPILALSRLKTRVNPQIEPSLQRYVTRGIVVSIEIDERGNTEVKGVAKANPRIAQALKEAVERWKFNPALVDNQPRCVATDLPINLIQP